MNKGNVLPLVGKVIRVDRGGPESSVGLLLHAGDDYIAVMVEEPVYLVKQGNNGEYVSEEEFKKGGNNGNQVVGYKDFSVIYYQTQHIKSISQDARKNLYVSLAAPDTENFEFIQDPIFREVLDNMKYQWVKINRGGPEKIEGILFEANNDFIVVIKNEEIVRLSMFHVRSLSYSVLKVEDPILTEAAYANNNSNDSNNSNE
ncbi:hypothetical protein [Ureibacillus sp. GCM10028918]|uniref:hypothetical protein n=1 Tax=Ureibacillus sp. GCM10028918 TaxID=3273429 RepID=UPI0036120970